MLTCIARSKQPDETDESYLNRATTPANKQVIKTLTSQIKDMALKASGISCNPCTGPTTMMSPQIKQQHVQKTNVQESSDLSTSVSERFRSWSYRRTGSKNSSSGRVWGKEMEARLKGISMGSGDISIGSLSASASGRRPNPIVLEEENEPKEWVAQVEPGVLITFVSLPRGGNDLKRIRFSREMFNKWQAQKWWQENYDKVMELYNVQRLNRQAFPLPTPPRSEDESSLKFECIGDSPITPPLSRERLPRTTNRQYEWVEQDEPGVYITIKALPGGLRELRRVRFSREKFGEVHARLWWEENRARIHKQYL
ncbi:Brevis radix-like protein 4 [Tanacetum coccineum]